MSHTKEITPGEYLITDLGISSNSVTIFLTDDKKSIIAKVLDVGHVKQFLWDLEPYGDAWTVKNNDSGLYLGVDNCGSDTGTVAPKKVPYPWKIEEDPNNSDVLRFFALDEAYALMIEGSDPQFTLALADYDAQSDFQRWRIQPYGN